MKFTEISLLTILQLIRCNNFIKIWGYKMSLASALNMRKTGLDLQLAVIETIAMDLSGVGVDSFQKLTSWPKSPPI